MIISHGVHRSWQSCDKHVYVRSTPKLSHVDLHLRSPGYSRLVLPQTGDAFPVQLTSLSLLRHQILQLPRVYYLISPDIGNLGCCTTAAIGWSLCHRTIPTTPSGQFPILFLYKFRTGFTSPWRNCCFGLFSVLYLGEIWISCSETR